MKRFLSLVSILQACLLFSCALSLPAKAAEESAFTLSHTFGNDMILQRDTEISIWGWSTHKGAKIILNFKGTTASALVDQNGEWLIKAPAQKTSKEGAALELSTDYNSYTITLEGVLVGDVYVLSGQSNAELSLDRIKSVYPDISKELNINSNLRFFDQSRYYAASVPATMASPQADVINSAWLWHKENAATMNFPAIGYFFAKEVSAASDVPIGVVMATSSGSSLSELMPVEVAQALGVSASAPEKVPTGGMYNALMSPFQKTSIKGLLFYQGENDQANYPKYASMLAAYVAELRKRFNSNFTFYNVQLSSHGGDGLTSWPNIQNVRFAQFDAYTKIDNSFLTVSMDWGFKDGDPDFAHPLYKKPIGERLAKVALAKDYGIGDLNYAQSPVPDYAYKTNEGIAVKFKYVGDGLKTVGSNTSLLGFRIMQGAIILKTDFSAQIISKDTVLLKYTDKADGVAYGTELIAAPDSDNTSYIANLANSSDLPAPAFKLLKILPAPTAEPVNSSTAETVTPTNTSDTTANISIKQPTSFAITLIGIALIMTAGGFRGVYLLSKRKR